MGNTLLLFLLIGTALMYIPISAMAKKNEIVLWKGIAISVILTIVGTLGTFLMYFVENGHFGGTSFFGAVFLVPPVFVLVSVLIRVPYGLVIDMCAVGECIMLALMKVKCLIAGCCTGKIWYYTLEGIPKQYPIREAELINALIIFVILLVMHKKARQKGNLYAWYLLIYGITRFAMNSFRQDTEPFVWILPPGHLWSLLAIVIGIVWLIAMVYKNRKLMHAESK